MHLSMHSFFMKNFMKKAAAIVACGFLGRFKAVQDRNPHCYFMSRYLISSLSL